MFLEDVISMRELFFFKYPPSHFFFNVPSILLRKKWSPTRRHLKVLEKFSRLKVEIRRTNFKTRIWPLRITSPLFHNYPRKYPKGPLKHSRKNRFLKYPRILLIWMQSRVLDSDLQIPKLSFSSIFRTYNKVVTIYTFPIYVLFRLYVYRFYSFRFLLVNNKWISKTVTIFQVFVLLKRHIYINVDKIEWNFLSDVRIGDVTIRQQKMERRRKEIVITPSHPIHKHPRIFCKFCIRLGVL